MSDIADLEHLGREPDEQPRIGPYLRRERETRGISVESVARSLKLNPKYIEALEEERFKDFPASTYIRVYLSGVAKHLSLDVDTVLEMYRRQEGLSSASADARSSKVDVSSGDKPSSPPWGAIVFLGLLLLVIAVVGNRFGLFDGQGGDSAVPVVEEPVDSTTDTPADSITAPVDSTDTETPDSATTEDTLAQAEEPPEEELLPPPELDSLILVISAVRDSVWGHVYRDGRSWMGFIKSGKPRVFRAADSLNVRVGQNANLRYTLNDEPLVPAQHKGVAVFRITDEGVTRWSIRTWDRTFASR